MLFELSQDKAALREIILSSRHLHSRLLPHLLRLVLQELVHLLDANPLGPAINIISVIYIARDPAKILRLYSKRGYLIGSQLDSGCDDNALLDILVFDEGVAFGQVVLDDEVLLVGERKVHWLDLFEVRGLHLLRLARHVHAVH